MPQEILIIANPVSGGGRGRSTAERALAWLKPQGMDARIVYTAGRGEATGHALRAKAEGVRRIVVCGGDGTIHEAVNGLAESEVVLGLLPCGRGNDLARALNIPVHPEQAARVLIEGATKRIDLGRVNGRYFSTVATMGFDSEVARLVYEKAVPFSGTLAYVCGVLRMLVRYEGIPLRMEGDFGAIEQRVLLAATGNTASYGGGMKILPQASPEDGLLDVCHARMMSRFRVLRMFPSVFWGGHVSFPEITLYRTGRLRLETPEPVVLFADGEPAGRTPATVEAVPRALAVICPA
jgi:diacylglycerol kinase (ATP)